MKILKSKGFFIKSFFLMIFLAIIMTVVSLQFFEQPAYNFIIKNFTANTKTASPDTVIIAIDDKSISYHRWPWPREYYAEIINFLNEYSNPKVIGFDAIIPGLDKDNPKSDAKFFQSVKNADKLIVGFSALNSHQYDKERTLAYNNKFKNKFQTTKINLQIPVYSSDYVGISEYPDAYFNAVRNVGSVMVSNNENRGTVTRTKQIISINGDYYPSLALKMYMFINGASELTVYPNKIVIDKTNLTIPTISTIGGIENWIRFYKPMNNTEYTHKKYSASDVIRSYENMKQGKKPIIDPREFDGKTVFIGANAKAAALSLEDALPTPLNDKQPGTDILATNYDNLVSGDFISKDSFFRNTLIIISLLSIVTFILISRCSFFISLIATIVISFIYLIIVIITYNNGYALPIVPPLAIQVVTSVFGYSYRFILEGRNKEKIKLAMGKYLSQDIMQNVVKNIDDIKLGGKRANVTVLFADIRGFTSMSEKMQAEEVSKILNEYFTEIEPIITQYNGVINKFIGDAVMAIFGEPIQDLNHPVNAVKCAYAMLKKVKDLQEKWLFEGKPKIEIGIGINTGDAFVGNIGSEKRLEYTVIGDTVNLASRIEGYNKVYHTNLLVSSSTYSYISDIADVIKISDVQIRGKSKKMDIYEILRINNKTDNKE